MSKTLSSNKGYSGGSPRIRHENSTIHDEVGMRHYYAKWGDFMGMNPSNPLQQFEIAAE